MITIPAAVAEWPTFQAYGQLAQHYAEYGAIPTPLDRGEVADVLFLASSICTSLSASVEQVAAAREIRLKVLGTLDPSFLGEQYDHLAPLTPLSPMPSGSSTFHTSVSSPSAASRGAGSAGTGGLEHLTHAIEGMQDTLAESVSQLSQLSNDILAFRPGPAPLDAEVESTCTVEVLALRRDNDALKAELGAAKTRLKKVEEAHRNRMLNGLTPFSKWNPVEAPHGPIPQDLPAFLAMDQPTVARWASYYLGVASRVRDARDANYLRSLICPFIGIRVELTKWASESKGSAGGAAPASVQFVHQFPPPAAPTPRAYTPIPIPAELSTWPSFSAYPPLVRAYYTSGALPVPVSQEAHDDVLALVGEVLAAGGPSAAVSFAHDVARSRLAHRALRRVARF
ncbi:hypothetical protein Q8F55_005498 [Vanrija albida]|uniref:Uncharacterized protein n=1 Tax=Vanrija albida TaxID=181172 RepID=A0ABR3Q1T2_9TREE